MAAYSATPCPTRHAQTLPRVHDAAVTHDAIHHTLSAPMPLTTGTATADFDTYAAVGTFGGPDPFVADLSGGGLSTSLPIAVPPGPGGLTPSIVLDYSSASISEQHNVQGAAPWVGEGWNLSLGAITWANHNVTVDCSPGCGPANWESSWQLSDPFGNSADLIPPNNTVSTYYDSTTNTYFDNNTGVYYNIPSQWHTSDESYAKIISYVGPNSLPGMQARPPCFRAWLTTGVMEEFGCTPDSLQYFPTVTQQNQPNGDFLSAWYLDLITDPQGNQIHLSYQADTSSAHGINYPRDVELSSITYDSPGCHDANAACTGSAWAPHVQIQFIASHTPTRWNAPTGCNTGASLRCDDPPDLSGSNGAPAPLIQPTFALDDVKVEVSPSGNGSWSLLRDEQFTYTASGPATEPDQNTGNSLSTAGEFLLAKVQLADENGATSSSVPPMSFGYAWVEQRYEDSSFYAWPSYCGWSWNEPGGNPNTCPLWNVNRAGNAYFLATADNGIGEHTHFYWQLAHNNTHGVNTGTISDPLTCNSELVAGTVCALADDQNWSRAVLTGRTDSVKWITQQGLGGPQTTSAENGSTDYTYSLTHLTAYQCPNCTYGYDWGNQNDGDYLDYYDTTFMGFAETDVTNPDASVVKHHYITTEGIGVFDGSVTCYAENGYKCYQAPWWHTANAGHGRETETDYYNTDGTTLLEKTTASYNAVCPPVGVPATPAYQGVTWDGNLVAELDHNNPVAVCDVQETASSTSTYNGSSSAATSSTTYAYNNDLYGRVAATTTTVNGGSPTTVVHTYGYIQRDSVSDNEYAANGPYLVDFQAFADTEDTANPYNRWSCTYLQYDNQGYHLGPYLGLSAGELTLARTYTDCGTSPSYTPGGTEIATGIAYDTSGEAIASLDADANNGDATHLGCTIGSSQYTGCASYDSLYGVLPATSTNDLNQTVTTSYTASAAGGYGQWPTSVTDANHQTTSMAYDPFGRVTSATLPGETSGDTTTGASYSVTCLPTSAQTPCAEVDTTARLNSSTTVTVQHFYDGDGRQVETVTPAPGGQYVVQFWFYDPYARQLGFASNPYFVSSGGFSPPDSTQAGTTYVKYDGLGRVLISQNALSQTTTTTYGVTCVNLPGLASGGCYEQTTVVDANNHQTATLADGWGRTAAGETFTGNSPSTYTLYQRTVDSYDENGNLTKILQPDGTHATTFSYDDAGRETGMSDPDRGSETYSYDANGNVTQTVDARGSSGTIAAGYDGLNRQVWRNTTNSPTGAYVTYTYDSTAGGNDGGGRLTGEAFTGGPSNAWSGAYSYTYDGRGQVTSLTETVNGTNYPVSATYDDAGDVTSQTYPDGEVVTTGYTAQGWLGSLTTTPQGQSALPLVDNVNSSGASGAFGLPSSLGLDNQSGTDTYSSAFAYDGLGRLTDSKTTLVSTGTTLFETSPSYDAAGNVVGVNTTLPQGTDNQAFCYDELDRLTWAGSTGTPPCGGSLTAGTLVTAQYTASYSYDNLDRLTNGPQGSYTYGDSAHLHAATSVGSGYTASYDASGNMTCRAPSSTATCSGTPTGAQLSYDNEGRLAAWQNAPSAPTSTANYLYDGEGHRVLQQSSSTGGLTTTTTTYVGNLEEIATSGATTTTTAYYYLGGQRVAESVNGTLSYLASDLLGSAEEALSSSGVATASVLYGPYGQARYSLGSMPGSYGFTGQHDDTALTGLDYYGARYYDPTIGQFTSADPAGALNAFAYVGGNPETTTDPSGALAVATEQGALSLPEQAQQWFDYIALNPTAGDGSPTLVYLQASDPQAWGLAASYAQRNGFDLSYITAEAALNYRRAMSNSYWQAHPERYLQVTYQTLPFLERNGFIGIPDSAASGAELSDASMDAAAHGEQDAELVAGLDADLADMRAVADGDTAAPGGALGEVDDYLHGGDGELGGCGESFSASTPVATPSGSQAIASVQVGQQIEAVDPATGQTSVQTVEHVFLDHDTDLLDVTLTYTTTSSVDAASTTSATASDACPISVAPGVLVYAHAHERAGQFRAECVPSRQAHTEVVHTTASHPWLSADRAWVRAGQLRVGERVRQAHGSTATVVALRVVPGAADMWDLTVSQVHTFAVGAGAYVVHNCGAGRNDAFERYGSENEAKSAEANNALENRKTPQGAYHRNDKWIGDPGTVDPRTLGKRANYAYKMTIETQPGTRQWMVNEGFESKPNEPGRFGIPWNRLNEFNSRIINITIRKW